MLAYLLALEPAENRLLGGVGTLNCLECRDGAEGVEKAGVLRPEADGPGVTLPFDMATEAGRRTGGRDSLFMATNTPPFS
jgi:hypothetical protein